MDALLLALLITQGPAEPVDATPPAEAPAAEAPAAPAADAPPANAPAPAPAPAPATEAPADPPEAGLTLAEPVSPPEEEPIAEPLSEDPVDEEFGDDSAAPQNFDLQPPTPTAKPARRHDRPPQFPKRWLGPVIGISGGSFAFGLDGMYFPSPYIGVGGEIVNTIYFDGFNLVQVIPKARLVMLPFVRISPYLEGGFGGAFFNRGLGSYGNWVGGTGVMWRISSRFVLDLGVRVEGVVPDSRFAENFQCSLISSPCSLGVGFRPGFMIGF